MTDFSVVICTYNGEAKLPQLLEKLGAQRASCRWEIIVIDNNSSDRTASIVQQFQNGRIDVPLRYYFEPQQGLAYARRCAVGVVHSPLIGFLDDDTLPNDDWVQSAYEFGQQHPQAGAYGSSIQGLYEISPPPGFQRIACCLAIIDRGELPFQYARDRGVLPAGAGMVVRKQAWLEQVPTIPQLAGVSGKSLNAKGEDVETLSYIRKKWQIWHNPAMKLRHIIPKERLEKDYLRNLFWRIGLSRYSLRKIGYRRWQWPFMSLLYCLNDLKRLMIKLLQTRQLGTVEVCELTLLLGSTVSPLHRSLQTIGQRSR